MVDWGTYRAHHHQDSWQSYGHDTGHTENMAEGIGLLCVSFWAHHSLPRVPPAFRCRWTQDTSVGWSWVSSADPGSRIWKAEQEFRSKWSSQTFARVKERQIPTDIEWGRGSRSTALRWPRLSPSPPSRENLELLSVSPMKIRPFRPRCFSAFPSDILWFSFFRLCSPLTLV